VKPAKAFWILWLTLASAASAQQAPSPSDEVPSSPAEEAAHRNGTGAVPPGVTLVPTMPPAGAPRPFVFPAAATKMLPNGLRVFVVADHSEPALAVQLVILSAGSTKDPRDIPGVAQMTANLLTQGTQTRTAREIAETIDFIGGSLMAAASRDSTTVTLDVVKKDADTGLDLMADVVLHPSFKREELERQRQQLLSGLTVQYSDPDYLATVVFNRVLYGSSPYGWPEEGTPETVKRLEPGQFVKFHDANYAPNQALVAFAGDLTPEEGFRLAEKYFGAWPKLDVVPGAPPVPEAASGSLTSRTRCKPRFASANWAFAAAIPTTFPSW
jgi:zinc protease